LLGIEAKRMQTQCDGGDGGMIVLLGLS
jgi:hypothetical protein